ncbi:MAG: antibiotic biosynthesis monooxygenase family protein [Dehalococcoidia bacterium]
MPYVRISLMKPMPGEREAVERINRELASRYSVMKGYITGYVLRAQDDSDEICRLGVWETEADADRAATDHRNLSLRSELHLKVQPGHADRSFIDV